MKSERERLGLSQAEVCSLTGVSRKTQFNYESGERYPDAAYLEALLKRGADVMFVLSGTRSDTSFGHAETTLDEQLLTQIVEGMELLLMKMRKTLSAEKKARIIVMLYRSFSAQHQVDPATIRQMIELAA